MKKILIFGGYGFIGNNLYFDLEKKYKVLRYTSIKKNGKKIKYNYKNFSKIINNFNPNIIFFFSGTSHPDYKNKYHLKDFKKTNLVLQNLLNALKSNNFKGKLFFLSTIGVYGSSLKSQVKENDITKPESFYTLSKIIAEQQCKFFADNFNMNINILRICSVFGPGLKRQIIYEIIKQCLSKPNNIKFYGNENNKREFLYIEDLILILKKIMVSKINNQTINIGSNKQYKIIEIVNKVQFFLKKRKKVMFLDNLKAPKLPLLNNNKLYKLIKLTKKFDIDIGLKKTILFYQKN